jgi:GAF domain-containing protein
MEETPLLSVEDQRVAELKYYRILDTAPEPFFMDITSLAIEISQAPIAFVGFMDKDRNWFKAKIGTERKEVPRELSFCNDVIRTGDTVMITDLSADARYRKHPLVAQQPQLRFYLGLPLYSPNHFVLGTICVLDVRARRLTNAQLTSLHALQRLVILLLQNYRNDGAPSHAVRDFMNRERVAA